MRSASESHPAVAATAPQTGRTWTRPGRTSHGPLVLVLSLVALCGVLFWLLHARNYDQELAGVPRAADAAAGEISDRLDAAVDHLKLLTEDMRAGGMDNARVEALAAVFLRNHPEVTAISWLDAGSRVQWTVPSERGKGLIGLRVSDRDEEVTLAAAVRSRQPTFTEPYASGVASGARKMALFVAVTSGPTPLGAFRCLFSLPGILEHAVPPWLVSQYQLDLVTSDGVVAARRGSGEKVDPNLAAIRPLPPTNGVLGVRLQRYSDGVDWEVLVFGALIVGLATGVSLAVLELSRDNKRRARLAREMEAARDLAETASQAKSDFLANVSHEIRTPIGAIIGYADMQTRSPRDAAETAAAIKRNGEHLLTLVNELLDLSKVEAGLLDVDPQAVPLVRILREMITTVRPLAAAKGLALVVTTDGPVPRTLRTDPVRLRQILTNIVGNAIKFTEAGGVTVTVSSRAESARALLVLQVTDSGIGIDAAQRDRLFRPFMQADNRIARRYGGTGLGLVLSKRLASLLGGDVVLLDSVPGEGSTFEVTIDPGSLDGVALASALDLDHEPPRPSAPVAAASVAPRRLSGLRVLVVEDGFDNQVILREFLVSEGACVDGARDGEGGVAQIRAGSAPDAILMDIQMPGMDGYQATAAIRALGFRGPILALTAHAMRGERERCLLAGCDEYLPKPVDFDQLSATIARRVGRAEPEAPGPAPGRLAQIAPVLVPPDGGEALVSHLAADARFAKVLGGFVGRLDARLVELRAAAATGDRARLANLAHLLRGTAGNYGYPQLSQVAGDLENAARSQRDNPGLASYIDALGRLVQRVRSGFAPPPEEIAP